VAFTVEDGAFYTLLGPSGCGKTTTLRCIAGLERPDAGEIEVGGVAVFSSTRRTYVPAHKRDIGMVFQSYAIWPHMTVYGNVAYPLRMRRTKGVDVRARVEETLAAVGLLALQDRLATQLSGGQQQRTAIARAIVGAPGLLLLDEPLSNLDAILRAQMRVELRQLQQRLNITTIYVTHDQVEAMVLSDRVIVMHGGQVQQMGAPREIYLQPANRFVAEFVGFNNFIAGTVVGRDDGALQVRSFADGPVLCCRSGIGASVGTAVVLAARGSQVDVARAPLADDANVLAGRVTEAVYLGEATEYHVEAGPLTLVAAQSEREAAQQGGPRLAVGEQVWLRLAPDAMVALPAGDGE